jgi:hypothetical protein
MLRLRVESGTTHHTAYVFDECRRLARELNVTILINVNGVELEINRYMELADVNREYDIKVAEGQYPGGC